MDKNKPIFVITTVERALVSGVRPVGFTYTQEEAFENVVNNVLDIYECGHYPYAVIEEVSPGIYTTPEKEFWFEWNKEIEKYQLCSKPKRFNKIVHWGLG